MSTQIISPHAIPVQRRIELYSRILTAFLEYPFDYLCDALWACMTEAEHGAWEHIRDTTDKHPTCEMLPEFYAQKPEPPYFHGGRWYEKKERAKREAVMRRAILNTVFQATCNIIPNLPCP